MSLPKMSKLLCAWCGSVKSAVDCDGDSHGICAECKARELGKMKDESVTFRASIAPLQSACTIASDGGARIKIDVPETDIEQVYRLLAWRGQELKITVKVSRSVTYGTTEATRRTARNPLAVAGG